jgi:glycosyltransferase involved in cell wall biosynthesis
MPKGKIVLITVPYDQGDILQDFLDWHLQLGIDLILAMDGGSTDGSRDVLEEYAKTGRLVWLPLPERDLTKYAVGDELAALARDRYGADWIILCDVDEFLCTIGADLQAILAEAERDGITLLTVPRRTMTGPPLQPGQRAPQTLTLRIDRTVEPTHEQQISWNLPAPFAFLEVGGHLAVRASAFAQYGAGAHVATTTWGKSGTSDQLYILHYAVRGFESLRAKVDNTKAWLDDNKHLAPGWGWHWRRWIHLHEEGRLREDYDLQFVSPERAQQLVREGICVVDTTIADWIARKQENSKRRGMSNWMQRLSRTLSPFRRLSAP